MSIYEDYDIDDILLDKPCNIDNINIYPVKINQWKQFQKYTHYLIMSREHYNLPDNQSFISCIVLNMICAYNNNEYPTDDNLKSQLLIKVLNEFSKILSIITKSEIKYKNNNNSFCFFNEENNILINDNNFDTIRKVSLVQNILFEPVIYKSKLKKKWAESVARGRAKNSKNLSLAEIISIVREGLKISYDEIRNLNIFQLYVDYSRLDNTKTFDTITLLKTTYGMDWEQLPNINYNDPIIDKLLRNPELDYFKDFDMDDVASVMK
jgi:hypothetical protein